MGYNSPSPLMLRLNEKFVSPKLLPEEYLAKPVANGGQSLAERAEAQEIVINQFEFDHVNTWPIDQQDHLRGHLLVAIKDGLPVSFNWEEASQTCTIIVSFGTALGVTFRSPFDYPPYHKP